jgi:thiamine biosynthesis lipoprotein
VKLDPPALRKSVANLNLDLSAIAKGHGVDQVAQLLDSFGIVNYLVEIGGEIQVSGYSNRGTPWRIAVETPNPLGRTVYRVVELRGGGMATSGDYRNFYVKAGKRYSHTIDPATGRPVTHELASVTVLMPNTTSADALATALMVLGPEAGFQFAEAQAVAAFFVVRQGEGFSDRATSLFKSYLKQEPSSG